MVAKHVTRKMLANHVFWPSVLFYTRLLLLLQPSVLWLSIVSFNNDGKPPPRWILREFDVSRIRSRLCGSTPPWRLHGWEGYPVWQTGLPALAGHPTYHVNLIKLKWGIIWTARVILPKRVTSPTWGPSHLCKEALKLRIGQLENGLLTEE